MTFCCALSCNMYFTLQNITWAKETLYISLIPQKVCQRFHLDCTLYSDSRQWRSALVKISAASFCCHWQCVESIGQEVWSCLSQQVTTNHGDNVSSQLCQKNVGPSLRSEDFRRWVRSERWKWCSISDFAANYHNDKDDGDDKKRMMLVSTMVMVVMMMLVVTKLVVRPLSYCYSSCPPFTAPLTINKRNFLGKLKTHIITKYQRHRHKYQTWHPGFHTHHIQ